MDHQEQTEHLFRRKYGEILAALLRCIGYNNFDTAEEAVQTAFQRALEKWTITGVPRNPAGWLYSVARNAALETLRRRAASARVLQQYPVEETTEGASKRAAGIAGLEGSGDDLAEMILLCCNPEVAPKAQVCLTLKAACGFSVAEIARALGMAEEAVKKIITRTKKKVADDPVVLEEIHPHRVAERFPLVMETLYALFNEGYAASSGESQLRREIAEEAIRLSETILTSTLAPEDRKAELLALRALMLLQLARFQARVGEQGIPIRLQEQDRGKWDREMIRAGLAALEASMRADHPTAYHIEARIAAEHAASPSFQGTNWGRILTFYDQLLTLKKTEHVWLNRVVALHYAHGADAAWKELEAPATFPGKFNPERLAGSFLFRAVRADLLDALDRPADARSEWEAACVIAPTAADRVFVERKLKNLSRGVPKGPP